MSFPAGELASAPAHGEDRQREGLATTASSTTHCRSGSTLKEAQGERR